MARNKVNFKLWLPVDPLLVRHTLGNDWDPKTVPTLAGTIPLSRHREEQSRKENVPLLSEPDLFYRYTDAWSL